MPTKSIIAEKNRRIIIVVKILKRIISNSKN